MTEDYPHTKQTTVQRIPEHARYDRATVHAILDEALMCHVGFVSDGRPFAIPTIHARVGDVLYLHGSSESRMLTALQQGIPVCVTVTLLDGLVFARSVFNHSMRYRSAVILGNGRRVADPDEKMAALKAIADHVCPGRWEDARGPNAKELEQTDVVCVPVDEASAKVSDGPAWDSPEDRDLPAWAGILPLKLTPGAPVADDSVPRGTPAPEYLSDYQRPT